MLVDRFRKVMIHIQPFFIQGLKLIRFSVSKINYSCLIFAGGDCEICKLFFTNSIVFKVITEINFTRFFFGYGFFSQR